MKSKQIGRVREIDGGFGLLSRLESMGIRPGTELRVVNSSFLRGPVTVRTGNSQIALGHGMARKILMEKEIDG
jgi:ferrous iron transport protein A